MSNTTQVDFDAASHEANLTAALEHAYLGVRVFPCLAGDRAPCIKGWQQAASTDEDQIRNWWQQFPRAVPGRLCSEYLVVDLDRKHKDVDGVANFITMLPPGDAESDSWPKTATPSNGIHITFRMPSGQTLGNRTGTLPKGIDIRGSGGFVLCEGAVLPEGRQYKPLGGQTGFLQALRTNSIPELPPFLLAHITAPKPGTVHYLTYVDPSVAGEDKSEYHEFLAHKMPGLVQQVLSAPLGNGNITLNRVSYMLGQFHGLGWGDAGASINALRNACLDAGWYLERGAKQQFDTLSKTIGGGLSGGMKTPGGPLYTEVMGHGNPDTSAAALKALGVGLGGAIGLGASNAELQEEENFLIPEEIEFESNLPSVVEQVLSVCKGKGEIQPALDSFVQCNMDGMYVPFHKFALASTIIMLGGLFGRKYKTENGIASNLIMVLAAPPSSGKGEAFDYWPRQIDSVLHVPDSQQYVDPRERISPVFSAGSSSVQALHLELSERGCMVAYRADGAGDLSKLADPKFPAEILSRDYLLESFDISSTGSKPAQSPVSIKGKERDVPVYNASLSYVLTMTDKSFEKLYTMDVLESGLGSRMLTILHTTPAGGRVPASQVKRSMNIHVQGWLTSVLAEVKQLDMAYHAAIMNDKLHSVIPDRLKAANDQVIRVPYAPEAYALFDELNKPLDMITRAATLGKLPTYYHGFGRVKVMTQKLALISALLTNRHAAVITLADVEWALHYVVAAIRDTMQLFDEGTLGEKTDTAQAAKIVEWMKTYADSPDGKAAARNPKLVGHVPRRHLHNNAVRNNLFKNERIATQVILEQALAGMIKNGVIEDVSTGHAKKFKLRKRNWKLP